MEELSTNYRIAKPGRDHKFLSSLPNIQHHLIGLINNSFESIAELADKQCHLEDQAEYVNEITNTNTREHLAAIATLQLEINTIREELNGCEQNKKTSIRFYHRKFGKLA